MEYSENVFIMERLKKIIADTFHEWGDGYGYNGNPEVARTELYNKIIKLIDSAFVAGRSKMTWEEFKNWNQSKLKK